VRPFSDREEVVQSGEVTSGLQAAIEVAEQFRIDVVDPVILQETNNTVVWLRPHDLVAKVGTRLDRAEALIREHQVCTVLLAQGTPVARPLEQTAPIRHDPSGFAVTLWHRVRSDPNVVLDPGAVGRSLQVIHRALEAPSLELPDFREDLVRARRALGDDVAMAEMSPSDLTLLRDGFNDLYELVEDRSFREQPLHGEPHNGNYLATTQGICWLDFESVCRGPLEWDLAFLPDEELSSFGSVDEDLLSLLRTVNSARVATWCWIQARFPEMRWHGQHHLSLVKDWRSHSVSGAYKGRGGWAASGGPPWSEPD
jgi:Phosphotransferase enzyme family